MTISTGKETGFKRFVDCQSWPYAEGCRTSNSGKHPPLILACGGRCGPQRLRVVLISACHRLRGRKACLKASPNAISGLGRGAESCALELLPLEQIFSSKKGPERRAHLPIARIDLELALGVATADSSSFRRPENGVKQREGR